MKNNEPQLLVEYLRDGLADEEHYGFVVLSDKERAFDFTGDDKKYPFFLRSCGKPLQAALLIDYGMDIRYNMTEEEIALCCASHAGEEVHVNIARGLLEKIGLDESYLKCGLLKPLSKTEQIKLVMENKSENVLQNNCSGKHIMMLGICKMNDWNLATYDEPAHPLQVAIRKKITELCELKKEYPETKDGCGVPIMAMPLENMLKGYLNLFCNPRYEKIKNAFLNHPYIIGGEDRTDTKIMDLTDGIVAKVGAGGLCVVVNTKEEQAFVVKISDCNMKARELVALKSINNLHWGEIEIPTSIKTAHGDIVGEIKIYA